MSAARAVAILHLVAAPAAAQQPDAVWPLPRLQGELGVDGISDDPVWQAVAPLPMTVYLPAYGADPTERTEARIGYDADAIYVMVDAWEAHQGGVRASSMIRDDDSPGDFSTCCSTPSATGRTPSPSAPRPEDSGTTGPEHHARIDRSLILR
jgi:hypothetical protein